MGSNLLALRDSHNDDAAGDSACNEGTANPSKSHQIALNFQMQVEAERKKRAVILESEGVCEAEKNKAEGEKRARILRSEAQMQEQVNKSQGLAKAAEAEKIQRILQSEAEMQSQVEKSDKICQIFPSSDQQGNGIGQIGGK